MIFIVLGLAAKVNVSDVPPAHPSPPASVQGAPTNAEAGQGSGLKSTEAYQVF